MILDLKKYGFEKLGYDLTIEKITSVGGPFFVKSFQYNSGIAGGFVSGINSLVGIQQFEWNANYTPPHKKTMLGMVTTILPHHYINIKCDGIDYQLAHTNLNFKPYTGWGEPDAGKIDPRIQELYDYLVSTINNENKSNIISNKFEGNNDISDDSYQLYLVEKYNIKKNDTLNKFVLNSKPYADLMEVLKVAHDLENKN